MDKYRAGGLKGATINISEELHIKFKQRVIADRSTKKKMIIVLLEKFLKRPTKLKTRERKPVDIPVSFFIPKKLKVELAKWLADNDATVQDVIYTVMMNYVEEWKL